MTHLASQLATEIKEFICAAIDLGLNVKTERDENWTSASAFPLNYEIGAGMPWVAMGVRTHVYRDDKYGECRWGTNGTSGNMTHEQVMAFLAHVPASA